MDHNNFDLPDIKEIPNGEKVLGTFSGKEMQSRLESLRTLMNKNEIDSVLFTSIHNINYYSDFLYCSFGRPYGLVVTADKATTISANIDAGQPYRRTYGENLVYTDWERDNYTKAVIELVGKSNKIGIEFDHVNLSLLEKLKNALPISEFIDVSQECMKLRMIKSDEEIELIRHGARIAD
ncbi:MAG TPA: aminopeptidase P family N-terminal domain-containing protein, partial [Acidimicrobiales bacterium]|nr:aminopeptidase P family N-terminal domain-containing protein [Acidimicrobiales bacterium]